MKRSAIWLFVFAVLLIAASIFLGESSQSGQQQSIEQTRAAKSAYASFRTSAGLAASENLKLYKSAQLASVGSGSDFLGFVFVKDSLVWWSDNAVLPLITDTAPGIKTFGNGWYLPFVSTEGNTTSLVLGRVFEQYPFNNQYLKDGFTAAIGLNDQWTIAKPGEPQAIEIDASRDFFVKGNFIANEPPMASVWPFILGLTLLFMSLKSLLRQYVFGFSTPIAISFLYLLRLLFSDWLQQSPLWSFGLFRPDQYASSWLLNSPADLILISTILFFLSLNTSALLRKFQNVIRGFTGVAALSIVAISFAYLCNSLVSGLVLDSRIPFDFDKVFSLNGYSFLGFGIIGLLVSSAIRVSKAFAVFSSEAVAKSSSRTAASVIGPAGLLALTYLLDDTDKWVSTLSTITMMWGWFIGGHFKLKTGSSAFTSYLSFLAGIALISSAIIFVHNQTRERESRQVLATRLENERDRVAEYLFEDVAKGIRSDKQLSQLFSSPYERMTANLEVADSIERRVLSNHLSGYWDRYDITVRSFNANGLPVNTGGDPTWSLNYYDQQLRQSGNDSSHYGLFFIGGSEGRMSYTGKAAVYDADTVSGIVVLSLTSKPLGGRSGFPELLLSGSVPQSKNISDYSFAYYRNDTMINKSGDFAYPRLGMNVSEGRSASDFFSRDGWSHLYHRTSGNAFLLVSLPSKGLYQFSTVFSYLFGIYGFVFLMFYASRFLILNKWRWRPNIGVRIRLSVVMIVVLTMLITGGATVWYIFNTYRADGGPETESRIRILLGALQDEIGGRYTGVPLSGGDEMNSSLAGLTKALGADFNLYDPSGRLLYSSQPKLYDQQIVAPLINPDALDKLRSQSASFVSLRERIGTFEYLSSYVPLLEGSSAVKGYLNISYFSQQAELEQRVSGFLVAVVNLYVLLFAFASFLTFLLSTRITQPLQVIREKLASVTFGKRNELLEWHSEDEIGDLVKEYNRMATELSAAAEQLARSERESAWREMARQVAHEIKNPLTPMKLGLQHLQRAWRDNHPDKDQITERMTKVLIEQIDALSNIATEFSGFAQMPQANKSRVALQEILRSVVELYSEYENINVVLIDQTPTTLMIFADKEQLTRVFVNLVKNAVQAVNQDEGGLVEVVVSGSHGWGLVEVRDNGHGISDEQKPRIFTPNFTTKSGGTGLGLAICHQIVMQTGGNIYFESTVGSGASFFVRLPLEKLSV